MLPRLLAICVAIALVALAAPSAMPSLIALVNPDQAAAVATTTAAAPAPPTLSGETAIAADEHGRYITSAEIDGFTTPVLVDTGANRVVLTAATVRRLGLRLADADYTLTINTANHVTRGAPVQLASVRVGNVVLRDVSAIALQGDGLELNLIGTSFLLRLKKVEAVGGRLVLVQ